MSFFVPSVVLQRIVGRRDTISAHKDAEGHNALVIDHSNGMQPKSGCCEHPQRGAATLLPPYDPRSLDMNVKRTKGKKLDGHRSTLDRRGMSQGIQLVSIAADAYDDGDRSRAMGIFWTGVDKILEAMPNLSHADTFGRPHSVCALKSRIDAETEIKQQRACDNTYHRASCQPKSIGVDPVQCFRTVGRWFVRTAVQTAVLIKQSPIPDFVHFLLASVGRMLYWIDGQYHVVQRGQNMSIECIKALLSTDENYRLHEYVSEALCIIATATLRVLVAFKETPRHPSTAPI